MLQQKRSISQPYKGFQSFEKKDDFNNNYLSKELSKIIDNLIKPEEDNIQLPL